MSTTPRTWVVGEVVSAAQLNVEIRDQFNAILGAFTSYSPAWTATGTAPVLNNGTLTGRARQVGKMCTATVKLTAGSTTTYGTGQYMFSLPAAVVAGSDYIGAAFIGDSSVGAGGYTTTGAVFAPSGSSTLQVYAGNTGAGTVVGATSPQTFANADRIWATVTYETA